MIEKELPFAIQFMLIALQLLALVVFLYFIWPLLRSERWKEKFIQNKQALSLIIVMGLILLFVLGMSSFFDAFFPVERLDLPKTPSSP
jgi:heme/copper-type cytochrome/quinol oxidase subunit 2